MVPFMLDKTVQSLFRRQLGTKNNYFSNKKAPYCFSENVTVPKFVTGGTLWGFSTYILLQNRISKNSKGTLLRQQKVFDKESHSVEEN